jgi:hypothetical protein
MQARLPTASIESTKKGRQLLDDGIKLGWPRITEEKRVSSSVADEQLVLKHRSLIQRLSVATGYKQVPSKKGLMVGAECCWQGWKTQMSFNQSACIQYLKCKFQHRPAASCGNVEVLKRVLPSAACRHYAQGLHR